MNPTWRIHVPASTSNLGPGFDTLGLAVGLHVKVAIEQDAATGFNVEVVGEGKGVLPENERNLILKTARELAGDAVLRASWRIESNIPVARGLGSSAAAGVAGRVAGHLLCRDPLPPRHQIFDAIAKSENHPDNAAAAVFGGFRIGTRSVSGVWDTFPGLFEVDCRLLVVIPDHPVSTPQARALLPSKHSRQATVRNTQCLAMLLSGLGRGDWEAVRRGCRDSFHEPYRLPLVPGLEDALDTLRQHPEVGGAYLSGAGPVLAAFLPDENSTESIADEAIAILSRQQVRSAAHIIEIDPHGFRVETL